MIIKLILVILCVVHASYSNYRSNVTEDVVLRFYERSPKHWIDVNMTNPTKILKAHHYDKHKNTVFYIFGFQELVSWDSVQTVVRAYTHKKSHNFILVDWSNMNQGNYVLNALPNSLRVARALADSIFSLTTAGLDPGRVHLVGFSLGGQLAGITGQNLRERHKTLIYRCTLLDAAGPGFPYVFQMAGATDAVFVDSIHTDSGVMGYRYKNGHADFWPNNGKRSQPGCELTIPFVYPPTMSPEALCSHWRAFHFWAESILNPTAFEAKPCGIPKIKTTVTPFMGEGATLSMMGNFCLRTTAHPPFGLGRLGAL